MTRGKKRKNVGVADLNGQVSIDKTLFLHDHTSAKDRFGTVV